MQQKQANVTQDSRVPLPGTVHAEYKKCGRSGCKCARGELHGPYYYRFYREGGRQHKQYVKLLDLADVMIGCRERQLERGMRRRVEKQMQVWRRLLNTVRRIERRGDQ